MISETAIELNSASDYFVFFATFTVLVLVYVLVYFKKMLCDS